LRSGAALLLLVALLAAACGATAPSGGLDTTPGASAAPTDAVGSAPATVEPSAAEPSASAAPVETPGGSPVDTPTAAPSDASPSASDLPSAATASAAASPCQPEGSNPNFWPGIVRSVSWDVYCAVLPKGWYVSSGVYRLANGGRLAISYKGPGGASLSLSEGSFCTDGSGCVPAGKDAGVAAFGALAGTLVAVDAGGYAIVVDRGQTPSWLMTTSGLDQATTISLGAALVRAGG
jgi:hypothetical protein